ncbi:MAG: hypothetical protein II296_03525, partial [Bacteroidaceae bacterium]|nr:hypothetical protein [Bacteroidaceae bacterium]
MRRLFKNTLFTIMALAASTAADAQKVTVSPLPQEISWGSEKAFDKSVAFKVKGLKSADADAVALLQKNFNLDGKKIKLIIGERGDKAVKKYNSLIPQKSEGYYLSIGPEEVVIAGNDERGTYYGTQTFLQIAS